MTSKDDAVEELKKLHGIPADASPTVAIITILTRELLELKERVQKHELVIADLILKSKGNT